MGLPCILDINSEKHYHIESILLKKLEEKVFFHQPKVPFYFEPFDSIFIITPSLTITNTQQFHGAWNHTAFKFDTPLNQYSVCNTTSKVSRVNEYPANKTSVLHDQIIRIIELSFQRERKVQEQYFQWKSNDL